MAEFNQAQAADTILYTFTGLSDGASPSARLVFNSNGNKLFGTTTGGGSNGNNGVVFKLSLTGVQTVLHSFGSIANDGSDPVAGLTLGANGELYGTTVFGGTFGCGTVFQLTPPVPPATTWGYSILYNFKGAFGSDGCRPQGDLILNSNGALHGTTAGGGTNGTVFKLKPPVPPATEWKEKVLYAFKGGTDGRIPLGHLVFDPAGALYGTTQLGGLSDLGTVFKLKPPVPPATEWKEKVLYSFAGGHGDGAQPLAGLAINANGALFGTTSNGGKGPSPGFGTVFKLDPPVSPAATWTRTLLYKFKDGDDGSIPTAGLIFDSDGALLGTTQKGGGDADFGTVFKLTAPVPPATNWTETVLHRFKGLPTDGRDPAAGLISDANGAHYGTTLYGATSTTSNLGTVFKIP
ncbi:MAG: choice-of-anchor tandem repeat GloVer-containing protein [Methylocella sp.]